MGNLVRKEIVKCLNDTVFYSISADGTTDITLCEQMAITLRFVQGMEVKEHLIDLVQCEVTTGEAITEEIKCSLERNSIPLKHCVGCSFDGASNMQGQNKGVATRIQECERVFSKMKIIKSRLASRLTEKFEPKDSAGNRT